jgi:AAHS family cis,cis-muconate transporter-like MFS transporter
MEATSKSLTGMELRVAVAVFVALTVDGLDLQTLALALPSIMKEMNISTVQGGALGTYTLIGMGVGGILSGWLADRVGRVRVVLWSVFCFTIFTGAIGLSKAYWHIAVFRFLSGFGLAAVYAIGNLLAAEYIPTKIRTTVLGTLQAGWSVGYIIAAIISSYVLPKWGWRPLFLSAIIPGVISMLLLHSIPEPLSWASSKRAGKVTDKKKNEFALIFADKSIRNTFIIWSIVATALQFSYYGANTWLPSYIAKDLSVNLKSMSWYVAATYTMMVVGKVITGIFGDLLGRKLTWVLCGLLTAIYIPCIIHFATPSNVAWLLLVFGFLYGAPYAINATYMSESFPGSVRGTAVAAAYNVGRIGGILSPLVIGIIAKGHSIGTGIAVLGISYAICAILPGLFIREKMFDPKAVEN